MKTSPTDRPRVRLLGWSPEDGGRIAALVRGAGAEPEDPDESPIDPSEATLIVARGGLGDQAHAAPAATSGDDPPPLILVADPEHLADLAARVAGRPGVLLVAEPFEDEELAAALRLGLQRAADRRQIRELHEAVRLAEAEVVRCRGEAEAESRRRTQFLAAISHDLRTPLWEIGLVGQVVQAAAAEPVPSIDWGRLSEGLLDGVAALRERVDDLFDLARLDLGSIEFRETRFLLAPFLDRVLAPIRREAGDRGLMFLVVAEPPWAALRTDADKLARVIQNLAGNAVDYTLRGEVRIWAKAEPRGGVTITVNDTGRGIGPEAMGSVFDEFAQAHNPERDRTKGTGLGLAICRRLVERLGGTIEVRSELGRGSEFAVSLPPGIVEEG